jgi:phytanoyl-CoA hydroxylase
MLNSEQIEQFDRDGYLVVDNVIDAEVLQSVRAEYAARMSELYEGWVKAGLVPAARPGWDMWDRLERCIAAGIEWYQPFDISLPHDDIRDDTPMYFGPSVFSILTHKPLLDIMESLLGPEITSNPIQHIRIKPPASALPSEEGRAHVSATLWHQDRGVGHAEADQSDIITVWLAITDATVENGCLQVIPNLPETLLPHCPRHQMTIANGFIDNSTAVPLPVSAGSIILMHPLTPHSSLPNHSGSYRWSLDLRYNVTGQPTGRDQFPEFVARSRNNPGNVLSDWMEWRSLWESARRRLASAPHIPQHRWNADSKLCA